MQSQLLIEPEQAPDIPSPCKNKFNIEIRENATFHSWVKEDPPNSSDIKQEKKEEVNRKRIRNGVFRESSEESKVHQIPNARFF